MAESVSVVYVNSTRLDGYCDYLFHFKADKKTDDHYIIKDVLGSNSIYEMTTKQFKSNFIEITDEEFEQYEQLLREGDSKKIEQYWRKLCDKYQL